MSSYSYYKKILTLSDHFHKLNYIHPFPHALNYKKANILHVAGMMYWWYTEHNEEISSEIFISRKYYQTHPTDIEKD